MSRIISGIIFLMLATTGLLFGWGRGPYPPQSKSDAPKSTAPDPFAIGKKLFVERCASCHNERGDKPLPTGLPLSEREIPDSKLTSAVEGRMKSRSTDEKRSVVLYMRSFMKKQ